MGGGNAGSTGNDESWNSCSLNLQANKEFTYLRKKGFKSDFAYDEDEQHHTTGKWEKEGENDDNYNIILHVEWTKDYIYNEAYDEYAKQYYRPSTGKTRRKKKQRKLKTGEKERISTYNYKIKLAYNDGYIKVVDDHGRNWFDLTQCGKHT